MAREVFDGSGSPSGEGFVLVAEELVRAALDVRRVAAMVRDGWVSGLDDGVDVGADELQATLDEFCSRWQVGTDALINRQHDIADRLTCCVEAYLEQDASSRAAYENLGAGVP